MRCRERRGDHKVDLRRRERTVAHSALAAMQSIRPPPGPAQSKCRDPHIPRAPGGQERQQTVAGYSTEAE
eukprot:3549099-Pyramimonas_sp.AAC.1